MIPALYLKPRFYALKWLLAGVFVLTGVLLPVFFVRATVEDLEGDWKMNENQGAIVHDSSINQHDGSIPGSNWWVAGISGSALHLEGGIGTYITIGDFAEYNFEYDDPFSLSIWFKAPHFGPATWQPLFSKREGSGNYRGYSIEYGGDQYKIYFALFSDFSHYVQMSITNIWDDDQWHNLVMTYDGSYTSAGINAYMDTVLLDLYEYHNTFGANTIQNTEPFMIGNLSYHPYSFNGSVDEARVYSKELTQLEVYEIYNEVIPPSTGIEPIITAEKPIECAWNQEADWNFDFKGRIDIPTGNPNAYTKFILRLYNRQAMEFGLALTDFELLEFPELTAGEGWSWNLSGIPITPFENGYSLTYWLEGYNLSTLKPFRWPLTPLEICGQQTVLSNLPEFPVSLIPTEWIEMIYEDCNSYEGIDKLMCEFMNFIKGVFAPSKGALDALSQDLDQIKTKFPFTYISTFFDFITSVRNGIDENKGISFEVFGNEGTVDFSFWEKTASVGGVVQSFSAIFKGFITFVILIGFVGGWLIPFIRRIL